MPHKVLLVDDEPNILMGLKRTLRNEPLDIETANSGAEGLGLLETTPVDLVITDQSMPGMSGVEFLSRVYEEYPDTIRFILTGNATLETAIQAINDGAVSRFFIKPYNKVELTIAIRQALEHKDLMKKAWTLLRTLQEQNGLFDTLEDAYPGITKVKRDRRGVIMIDETPGDPNDLMSQIQEELDKA